MTVEQSHGKPRMTRPRMSDVNDGTDPQRHRNHDADGRAAKGNKLATGRGWKRALLALLPDTADAKKLYDAAVRELVHDTPFARASCLRWVRHTIRESETDAEATKAGIATELGMKQLDRLREHSDKAEKAAVAALTWTKRKSPSKSAKADASGGGMAAVQERLRGGTP